MALLVSDPVCFRRLPNGDVKFPLELAAGLEAVAIGIRTRAQLFAGEWFLNFKAGIRYLASRDGVTVPESAALLAQHYDPLKARAEFRRELLTTPGVIDLPTLETSFDAPTRKLALRIAAKTQFGDTPVLTVERTF